jgi:hypothetical protein
MVDKFLDKWTRKRLDACVLIAFFAPAFAACSGPSPVTSTMPALRAMSEIREATPQVHHNGDLQFNYQTIDDPYDPATEILGINNLGKLVGVYGEGTPSDPYIGMLVHPPYQARNFFKENYPGAVDTILTSLNNTKTIAGWYQNSKGQIFGCTLWENLWTNYMDSKLRHSSTQVTELLGINDDGLAPGFYKDSGGVVHAFELNTTTGQYVNISPPGSVESEATGISGRGDLVGWLETSKGGPKEGWFLKGGHYTFFNANGAQQTMPTAVNWSDDIVGSFVDAAGTHGFILTNPLTSQNYQTVDEPNSNNNTVIASLTDRHNMVGYYSDASGNIHGFLATLKAAK